MLKPVYSNRFKKDVKLAIKRGKDLEKLAAVIEIICSEECIRTFMLPIINNKIRDGAQWTAADLWHIRKRSSDYPVIFRSDVMAKAIHVAIICCSGTHCCKD